jgi:hypothetical protein
MRAGLVMSALAVVAVLGDFGCSGPQGSITPSGTTAFTVDHGDEFVVSAAPDHIVLKKRVDNVDFPFDEKSLTDKAVLIHPVVDRANEGVYSRALAVHVEDDTYVIDARPLTLAEMATMTEDDIVRIYMDLAHTTPQKDLPSDVLKPEMLLHPLAFSANGLSFNGFNLTGVDFGSPIAARPGIAVKHTIDTATLTPEVLADYSHDDGLALGFRGEMEWKSKLELSGRVSGEFFHSTELEAPPLLVYVPIGPVPVPLTLKGKAFVSCGAATTGEIKLTVDVELKASLSASMQVNPDTSKDISSWITQGPWPAEASGSASVTPSVDSDVSVSVSCAVPRVEVHADVAGITGPYVAVTPAAIINSATGGSVQVQLAAGVSAGALGFNTGAEMVLYTWKP